MEKVDVRWAPFCGVWLVLGKAGELKPGMIQMPSRMGQPERVCIAAVTVAPGRTNSGLVYGWPAKVLQCGCGAQASTVVDDVPVCWPCKRTL